MRDWLGLGALIMAGMLLTLGCPSTDDDDDTADDDAADDDVADDDSASDDDTADDDTAGDDDSGGTPNITLTPQMMNFQDQCIGVPWTLDVAVGNNGDAPLVVSGQISNLPIITFVEFQGNVGPGANPVLIDLTCTCTVEGPQQGNFRVYSNDPDDNPKVMSLAVNCQAC